MDLVEYDKKHQCQVDFTDCLLYVTNAFSPPCLGQSLFHVVAKSTA